MYSSGNCFYNQNGIAPWSGEESKCSDDGGGGDTVNGGSKHINVTSLMPISNVWSSLCQFL